MLRIVKVKTVINAYKKNEIGVVFAPGNLKRLRAKGGNKTTPIRYLDFIICNIKKKINRKKVLRRRT